jgi:hypothetical protein
MGVLRATVVASRVPRVQSDRTADAAHFQSNEREGGGPRGANGSFATTTPQAPGARESREESGPPLRCRIRTEIPSVGTRRALPFFGFAGSVALSSDASTLAVGAYGESSSATGLNGNQVNTSAAGAGAVYVFR